MALIMVIFIRIVMLIGGPPRSRRVPPHEGPAINILFYTILDYNVLYHTILYYTILYHTVMFHTKNCQTKNL